MDEIASVIADQLAYYDAIANEYHRHAIDVPGQDELLEAISQFRSDGHVLELACGTGVWTEKLSLNARKVTAVDGSSQMLERARDRLADARNWSSPAF